MDNTDYARLWDELAPKLVAFHQCESIDALRAAWDDIFVVTNNAAPCSSTVVDAGGTAAEWITTANSADERVLVYLHGGGFTLGSVHSHRDLIARLADGCGMRALGINYRRPPEHPFPAALEDVVTAWRWLLGQGIQAQNTAFVGDSAGGGLTMSALVAIRDAGLALPGAAALFSPWTDLTQSGESMTTRAADDPIATVEILNQMAATYLHSADATDWRASPLQADLQGLPPLLVQVGENEILYDDSARLVKRVLAAGGQAELECFDGMCHVFQIFASRLPQAQDAIDHACRFVRNTLSKQ